jgi:hypothetical protein
MNIRVHIERLILDGLNVEAGDGAGVQAAVEAELEQLVTAGGLAPGLMKDAHLHSVNGGSLRVSRGQSATALGGEIARSVYGGVGATGKKK